MNKKQIEAFFKQMEGDPPLREAFMEFAREHGLSSFADELSEGDLETVAGGIDTVPLPERPRLRTTTLRSALRDPKGIIDTNT